MRKKKVSSSSIGQSQRHKRFHAIILTIGAISTGAILYFGQPTTPPSPKIQVQSIHRPILKVPVVGSQIKLMSQEEDFYYRNKLPRCTDFFANSLAGDSRLIWYTSKEMPCTYQLNNVGHSGGTEFHLCNHNISGDPIESQRPHGKGGNGNIEFPWLTGGTDNCPNVNSVKFLLLPEGKSIQMFRPAFPENRGVPPLKGYGWTYPVGTIVGELLLMKAPNGEEHAFELRLRIKDNAGWDVDIFRPYPTVIDLVNKIKELRPHWQSDQRLAAAIYQIEQSVPKETRLADNHPDHVAFDVTAGVDELPELPESLVYELMDTPFYSAKNKTWKGANCFAPTTRSQWSIVPARYDGTFLGTDRQSCNKCHENTFDHVTKFDYKRGWYGFVRGSDKIFSFHPIDPDCIRFDASLGPVVMRQTFLDKGIVKW